MEWMSLYKQKLTTAEEAMSHIKSGENITFSGANSAPPDLVNALCKRYQELENVTLWSGLLMYPFEFLKREYKGHLNYITTFYGPVERMFAAEKNTENFSFHFSNADKACYGVADWDYLMCEVSPPDAKGYMSFGPTGIYHNGFMRDLVKKVVVQVNDQCPYVNGVENVIHVSEVDAIVESSHPIPEMPEIKIGEAEMKIGQLIAEQVPDRATIQIGIGGVANAVGHFLDHKKDLGIHTELLTDSMVDLAERGVITNRAKNFHHGKGLIGGLCIGSKATYEFIDRNPTLTFAPVFYVNNRQNIARNDNFISINNALSVDLTGQVASESIGFSMYSGTGGQADFVRGATQSKGGKSFIALKSTYKDRNGGLQSRIVSVFAPGTAVTSVRADVMYIVTEFGIAYLWQKTTSQRVQAMISIAHPDFRGQLERDAVQYGLL
ncbi:Acetyl-CoA hydrolase/transferase N-terminal domain-containing protein [Desulfatibacillum alkenivorans DSM 16219]|jgi:4-hydroxybutyrate CoA-transferase|uniref:Acetyl-CoA hydrolase/transferase N-terminal domain-containing protein n=1 Tax=Desulfatibacillum alkenivorans DSM 16219 TaxID=1121393 RepID=A0A1M6PRE6_9BACT|nr:acetyl-CoA hydrolase/transferase C-terminal domain-containing protein [Desulfatibacillum alkenivorans]SHK10559.1 Acetyl-CoA hydrolase/transferase N-terminal domain-containing protein [Desulfatibacillum alkenivorans DSM 16219]